MNLLKHRISLITIAILLTFKSSTSTQTTQQNQAISTNTNNQNIPSSSRRLLGNLNSLMDDIIDPVLNRSHSVKSTASEAVNRLKTMIERRDQGLSGILTFPERLLKAAIGALDKLFDHINSLADSHWNTQNHNSIYNDFMDRSRKDIETAWTSIAPTSSPTLSPTNTPITGIPTEPPTVQPTESPTNSPVPAPTEPPTTAPTPPAINLGPSQECVLPCGYYELQSGDPTMCRVSLDPIKQEYAIDRACGKQMRERLQAGTGQNVQLFVDKVGEYCVTHTAGSNNGYKYRVFEHGGKTCFIWYENEIHTDKTKHTYCERDAITDPDYYCGP